MNGKCFRSIVLLLVVTSAGYCAESGTVTLDTVRALVARNESLLNPIKMSYTVKKSRTGERPQSTRGPGRFERPAGGRYHVRPTANGTRAAEAPFCNHVGAQPVQFDRGHDGTLSKGSGRQQG